jgi:hypothetical protein
MHPFMRRGAVAPATPGFRSCLPYGAAASITPSARWNNLLPPGQGDRFPETGFLPAFVRSPPRRHHGCYLVPAVLDDGLPERECIAVLQRACDAPQPAVLGISCEQPGDLITL